ncbi:MAG: BON domain-containing protein [Acidobacteria bacterium]|nr:BON domain-containing protein [Acidobacteriota bacterium]
MSSRYDGRGSGRYGDSEDARDEERPYERGSGAREYGRGGEYGGLRRGGYAGGREYGQGRDYDARDAGSRYGTREYGGGDYGTRYGREVFERGGYAGSSRRYEGEDYGRTPLTRAPARDYERRVERPYRRDEGAEEVHDYDTDYGRTTSRFYGRSGYEYGRDDYEDDRREHHRHEPHGHDERRGESWLDRAADQVRSWFGGDEADDRGRGRYQDEARRAYGRGEGKFRGRGPRNYRRSDERLREEVCDRLTDNEWLDASDVEVNVVVGEVILNGSVDSRYAKRLAENIAESCSGVANVQNNLRVQSYEPMTAAEAPLAGLDAPLPLATSTTATPASDITATSSAADVDDLGRPSTKAAGRS